MNIKNAVSAFIHIFKLNLILLTAFFLLFACGKDGEKKDGKENNKVIQKQINTDLTIPVQKVNQLNIENFVKIYLSRMEHEIKWAVELQGTLKNGSVVSESSPNIDKEDPKEFLEKKDKLDKDFFANWGITQEQFEQFALENDSAVQEYIENHIEIQDFIDKIQEKNRQLYDIGDNEDENTENENNTKTGE